jgi:hypothetical protein
LVSISRSSTARPRRATDRARARVGVMRDGIKPAN